MADYFKDTYYIFFKDAKDLLTNSRIFWNSWTKTSREFKAKKNENVLDISLDLAGEDN